MRQEKKNVGVRDGHQLAIARREALGRPSVVPSKKRYSRKAKHRKQEE